MLKPKYHVNKYTMFDTNECQDKAKAYGVKSFPAVSINGTLVDCCKNNGIDNKYLIAAGLGR